METTNRPMPQARDEGLVIQELSDETLVYDLERHRAHALNQTAAWVWRHCDGKTSVAEMAARLHHDLGVPSEEEAVWLALQRLGRARLLKEKLVPPASGTSTSRRTLMRGLAMAGGLALVTSVIAPEAAHAASACASRTGTFNDGQCGMTACASGHTCKANSGKTACVCV